MPAPEFDVRNKSGGTIQLFRKFTQRKIKLVPTLAYEWPDSFHECQLIERTQASQRSTVLRIQLGKMLQIGHLEDFVADRFLVQAQAFDLSICYTNQFDTVESRPVLPREFSEVCRFLGGVPA